MACQNPLPSPLKWRKKSLMSSSQRRLGLPIFRWPSGSQFNNKFDHRPSVRRAMCPASLNFRRFCADTQSSIPAFCMCTSEMPVARCIHSTKDSASSLSSSCSSSSVVGSWELLLLLLEASELLQAPIISPAIFAGFLFLPTPTIHLTIRRCVVRNLLPNLAVMGKALKKRCGHSGAEQFKPLIQWIVLRAQLRSE